MIAKYLLSGTVALFVSLACGQQPTDAPAAPTQSAPLHEIGRPWPHIGSAPQAETPTARSSAWPREIASFKRAFDSIQHGWTGEAVESAEDLRFKVRQYEDAVRTVTDGGGYGNLVLADTLRRFSFVLLSRYVVTHPSEYATVGDLLSNDRINLLDCTATSDMIMEELKLPAPSGKWQVSGNHEEIASIYRADGATPRDVLGRNLLNHVVPSSMIARRDVSGLMTRLIDDTAADVVLRALVEFLKRGGTITNLESFPTLMADQREKLRLPATTDFLGAENVGMLIYSVRKSDGKAIPFSELAGR